MAAVSVEHALVDCRLPEGIAFDEELLFQVLRKSNAEGPVTSARLSDGSMSDCVYVFTGPTLGCHWTVRTFQGNLITIDIMQPVSEENNNGESEVQEMANHVRKELGRVFGTKKPKEYPPIKRGCTVHPYYETVDNLFIEYDFDKMVYEEDSPFQNIKIMHSKQFGNVLILDDDVNLAESDLAYTKAILGNGREDYNGKTVLVLGGGDGGILNELLKCSPEHVTMVEIDKLVLDCAAQSLRGICGSALDSLSGKNYEVIVDDCVKFLERFIAEGKQFDYVINDLTAIPISTEPRGSGWDFMRLILDLSMKVLSPRGKYFTQGNSLNAPKALQMYEEQLAKLTCGVQFSRETICVPSYHEMWVFYEIWKK